MLITSDGKKVEIQFNLPTGSSTIDDSNNVTGPEKKLMKITLEDGAPSNETSSTEANSDSKSGTTEMIHQLVADVTSEPTPSVTEPMIQLMVNHPWPLKKLNN